MKLLPVILCTCLASCATVPKAIIPPPSVISKLNVDPVTVAGKATRDAAREVAAAGSVSREAGGKVSGTTRRLADSLAKAEAFAEIVAIHESTPAYTIDENGILTLD